MSIFVEVIMELVGMFLADAMLTIATIVLVTVVAVVVWLIPDNPLFGGGLLFLGCLAIVICASLRAAGKRRAAS
ncbi:hypothetical protein [Bradyrhizobium tropiciagri]|uniref:hypothetical protein n=1 Tax=Bradyrhizobium tropiciagri TaxID=312253 RepID=UPI00067DBDC6|nr:hypothetical protein [Bradyrhizobium tropiciagri]